MHAALLEKFQIKPVTAAPAKLPRYCSALNIPFPVPRNSSGTTRFTSDAVTVAIEAYDPKNTAVPAPRNRSELLCINNSIPVEEIRKALVRTFLPDPLPVIRTAVFMAKKAHAIAGTKTIHMVVSGRMAVSQTGTAKNTDIIIKLLRNALRQIFMKFPFLKSFASVPVTSGSVFTGFPVSGIKKRMYSALRLMAAAQTRKIWFTASTFRSRGPRIKAAAAPDETIRLKIPIAFVRWGSGARPAAHA